MANPRRKEPCQWESRQQPVRPTPTSGPFRHERRPAQSQLLQAGFPDPERIRRQRHPPGVRRHVPLLRTTCSNHRQECLLQRRRPDHPQLGEDPPLRGDSSSPDLWASGVCPQVEGVP